MKAVIQRVLSAGVTVAGEEVAAIGPGALILLGIASADDEMLADKLAKKIAELRIFEDDKRRMNRSVLDTRGSLLVVSNFTLYANCSHGRRPEFLSTARPEKAEPLYRRFVEQLREQGIREVLTGRFGAEMQVSMVGDGPVTIVLDTDDLVKK